jgi:hypothetical protein
MLLTRRAALGGLAALAAVRPALAQPCCGPITPAGQRIVQLLDESDVERRWLAGDRIAWETGLPLPTAPDAPPGHTHCSAYVAAMAKRLGVYILRPPEHGQVLLANAQGNWLAASKGGWRPLADYAAAQAAANQGQLVVASFINPNPRKAGHIAIIRPSEKDAAALAADGPAEAQAGQHNYSHTDLRIGFRYHRGAFDQGLIRCYAHDVPA